MKKKLKAQNAQRQAQKRAARSSQRRAEYKPTPKAKPVAQSSIFESLEEFNLWRAQGVNYILSDFPEATWNPMFDLYNGGAAPDLNGVAKTVMDKFGPDTAHWPPEGRAALGWAVSSPDTLATYYLEALTRLRAESPEGDPKELVRKPHHPVVWSLFDYLKTELAKRTA